MYVSRSDVTDLLYEHGETATEEETDLLNKLVKEVGDLAPMREQETSYWVVAPSAKEMSCERCGETFAIDKNNLIRWEYCPCCGRMIAGHKPERED